MTNKSSMKVKTRRVLKYIKTNTRFAKSYEKSWLKELISDMDFGEKYLDSMKFLTRLKNKRKTSNKKQCAFYIKIFQELGCAYTELKIRV